MGGGVETTIFTGPAINPYQEQTVGPPLNERRMLKGVRIDTVHIFYSRSAEETRAAIDAAIEKAKNEGCTNIQVHGVYNPSGCFNGEREDHYLAITGDRMETAVEYQKRIDLIIADWQKDYENYLHKKAYWENELGQARLKEVMEKCKRPISYPRAR